jgi:hypothetical protein
MQSHGKHTPMAIGMHTTLEEVLEAIQAMLRLYYEDQWDKLVSGS